MDFYQLLLEYLVSEEDRASIYLPSVGVLTIRVDGPYQGRGEGGPVEVPRSVKLMFSQNPKPDQQDNNHFFEWAEKKDHSCNKQSLEPILAQLASTIAVELDQTHRCDVAELGLFNLKRIPFRSCDRTTGARPPEKIRITFKPSESLRFALMPILISSKKEKWENVSSAPFAISSDGASTFSLEKLPSPDKYWKLCQSLAVLSICNDIEGDDGYRPQQRFLAIPSWDRGVDYASMANSQGDDCDLYFTNGDALIRGFAHEYPMASWYNGGDPWPGTFDGLPEHLQQKLFVDYLEAEKISFCTWFLKEDKKWHKGKITSFPNDPTADPDGSGLILSYFPFDPAAWVEEYAAYYGRTFDLAIVTQIYEHRPLTMAMVKQINPEFNLPIDAFVATGYPVSA